MALKSSHAGIIRIGFEGISQPHNVEHPCFNIVNWNTLYADLQTGADSCSFLRNRRGSMCLQGEKRAV